MLGRFLNVFDGVVLNNALERWSVYTLVLFRRCGGVYSRVCIWVVSAASGVTCGLLWEFEI